MNMKFIHLFTCLILFCSISVHAKPAPDTTNKPKTWELIFKDEFNRSGSFDTTKWIFCERHNAAWTKYLTPSSDYAYQEGGNLVLRMDNKTIPGDSVPYHSGGIKTQTKFSFLFGKVEVRAKFNQGKGSWPAIWMMPENSTYGGWPNSGEIDIMEHVNNENVVHQTIHNASVTGANGGSTATKSGPYNSTGYNIYGIVWTPDEIQFYVNNQHRYTYKKTANATSKEWPFDKPFHLILNQSGGAGWPGPITDADLPFSMYVDWVKVYKEK
jgi:beta-glucanase (GH16 family)